MKNKLIKIIIYIALATILITLPCAIYVNDYYHADKLRIDDYLELKNKDVDIIKKDNTYILKPKNPKIGLIFYPGGKVEYTSYLPLMKSLADEEILTILIKMPFNLAILDFKRADNIKEEYKEITDWYIGGHSLGGTSAGLYLSNNHKEFDGLILLGSYITNDLSKTNLKVLSIYGTEDKIMNKDKYKKNKKNLPNSFNEVKIVGGNHSFFGMYGLQKKDGKSKITNEEQIKEATKEIVKFINNSK